MSKEGTRFMKVTDGNDKEYGTIPLNANPDLLKKVVDKNKQKEEEKNKMVGNRTSEAAEQIDQEIERIKQQEKEAAEKVKKSVAEGLAAAKERIGPMKKAVLKDANKAFSDFEKVRRIKRVKDVFVPEDYPKMSDKEKKRYVYDLTRVLNSILTDLPQDQVAVIMNRINLEGIQAREMAKDEYSGQDQSREYLGDYTEDHDEDLLPIERIMKRLTEDEMKTLTKFEEEIELRTINEAKKRFPVLMIAFMLENGWCYGSDTVSLYSDLKTFIDQQTESLASWTFSV